MLTPIPIFKGEYYLDTKDNIHKKDKKQLNEVNQNDYQEMNIHLNGKSKHHYVHCLICETFFKKSSRKHNQVDHINKNLSDNRVSNLRWVSISENAMNRS